MVQITRDASPAKNFGHFQECSARAAAGVQAQEGCLLIETATRGNGVMNVELAVTAFEVGAAQSGQGGFQAHGA